MSFQLSPEQQRIVGHPLEPLRVAAGAGTGKTTTIVLRAVHLISPSLPPEAVLGITFTNKAAEELADRLREELPDLAAEGREVEVTTYHGFAWKLLQEFGALVGVERDHKVIGPGYVRQLLAEQIPVAGYSGLDMTSPAHRVNEAAMLSRQLSENLRTESELIAFGAGHDSELWTKRRELASLVGRYNAAKRSLGVVDYGDLVRSAHELVTRHPEIARRVRSRYALLLLDEYQDTDPAQRELLLTIFGSGFPVTAVGDSDQTIYEWRGASLENFRAFPDHFRQENGAPAGSLPLTLNRRSGRLILELANRVRASAHPEAGFDPLRPAAATGDGSVHVSYHRTSVQEATAIAAEIRRLNAEEGVAWSQIAVLFRKNQQINLVREALAAEGIPHEVASLGGLLDVPEVADLHAWLRVLARPDDSAALARLLLGGRYRLGFGDLAHLARWVRERGRGSRADEGLGWPLLEAVDRLDDVAGLSDEARRRLEEFRKIYRRLLTDAQSAALVELCRRILDVTSAWAEIDAATPAAALTARLNIYRFLDLAEDWSPLEGRPSLEVFLAYLDLLREERAADELDTARLGSEEAVALLTVHRAKGLEWHTVFVPAVARGTFPASSLGFDNPREKPQHLPFELRIDREALPSLDGSDRDVKDALRARHDAQEWRTAYVAVTRAKSRLYVSGAWWYTTGRHREPSELFSIAASMDGVERGPVVEEPGVPPSSLGLPTVTGAPDPLFPEGWQAALRAATQDGPESNDLLDGDSSAYDAAMDQIELVLEGLPDPPSTEPQQQETTVSVTGLVTLAVCPQRFQWSELLRLPRRPDPYRARGVEVHRLIELHNRGQMALEELQPGLYDAEPSLDISGAPSTRPLATRPFDAFLASRFADVRPLYTETPIDVRLDAGRVRGRIDAIYEPEPGHWEIVDFKSGHHRDDSARLVQLQAYAVAAVDGAVAAKPPDRISVTFAYLGSGEVVEDRRGVDSAWLAAARERLEELLSTASGDSFPRNPGTACAGCDFLHLCPEGQAWVDAAP